MRKLVKTFMAVTVVAWVFTSPASAATLTLIDPFGADSVGTTWTLVVEDSCTTCDVSLTAFFEDPDDGGALQNAYTGTYLDSFQWVVTDPNTDITALSNPLAGSSGFGNWDSDFGEVVNANGCQPTGNDAFTCTVWTGGGAGFLVANDATYTWSWTVDFEDEMLALAGNIRASFDNADNHNFNIFSPGGGTFTTTTDIPTTTTDVPTTTTENIPEPTILTLLGAGLVMAGRRLRRRTM